MAFSTLFTGGLILCAHALLIRGAAASSGNFEISHLVVDCLSEVDATSEADSFLCCEWDFSAKLSHFEYQALCTFEYPPNSCFQLILLIKTPRKIQQRSAVFNGHQDKYLRYCHPRVHAPIITSRCACPRVSMAASRT